MIGIAKGVSVGPMEQVLITKIGMGVSPTTIIVQSIVAR